MPTAATGGGRYIMYDAEVVGPSPNLLRPRHEVLDRLAALPGRIRAAASVRCERRIVIGYQHA